MSDGPVAAVFGDVVFPPLVIPIDVPPYVADPDEEEPPDPEPVNAISGISASGEIMPYLSHTSNTVIVTGPILGKFPKSMTYIGAGGESLSTVPTFDDIPADQQTVVVYNAPPIQAFAYDVVVNFVLGDPPVILTVVVKFDFAPQNAALIQRLSEGNR